MSFLFGSENGRVSVEMNHAVWESLMSGGGWDGAAATQKLRQIGLSELRGPRYNYSEVELDYVARDALFEQSSREGFLRALDLYKTKRRLPPRILLEFTRPSTRNRRDKEGYE
ncbi:MAG: hypothetical protein KGI98_12105 [Euryarchaeota archaeon]|nr:hypothetical protein [Euryarchaeota archaeon]MDE1881213.1 hypothetical protein [Euryarchaeota archaeon]